MFFVYNTDAPIYHWPITTVTLIVVNVVVFLMEVQSPGLTESLALQTGHGLIPIQWLTSIFDHLGYMHILGNMFFLWAFGLVVEGKIGWWKMLAAYLGIGMAGSAFEQAIMSFGPEQYILGASGAIFGLMVISLIWAPENSMECVFVLAMHPRYFEVPIKVFVGLFLAWQIAVVVLTHAALTSEFLHTVGGVLGAAFGIWMVKTKRVDCENWDIFSTYAGRHRMSREELAAEEMNSPESRQRRRERAERKSDEALQLIRENIAAGGPQAALAVYRRMLQETPDWTLPEPDLRHLISALDKAKLYENAIPLMADYLTRYTEHAAVMRIKLAQVLVAEGRPRQAVRVLGKLNEASLDARQLQFVKALRVKALKMHEEDPYEVADKDW